MRREREKERGERDRETPMNNSTKREKNDGYICMYFESLCMHVCMYVWDYLWFYDDGYICMCFETMYVWLDAPAHELFFLMSLSDEWQRVPKSPPTKTE